jgi:CheY-like chemotaxis protein
MPGMTGADMARIVRGSAAVNGHAIADTPIVMLTSVDQSLSNSSYRDLAIEAQLIKPARSAVLLQALVTTIQNHRSHHAAHDTDIAPSPSCRLDLALQSEPAAARVESASVTSRHDDRHRVDILVAEDNEVNQLVFTQILGETDHSFAIVGNGRLALKAFGEMSPRMILMDVSMPEMNGLEATGAIRAVEAGGDAHVPIVGVTAHALKGDRERCLDAGMDDYLPKPISPRALIEKVERWIWSDRRRDRDAG